MMTIPQSALLGILEGLTEFLPISSSGHLILARELLHINTGDGLTFDAVIQLGAILSVFIIFWKDIFRLILSVVQPSKTTPNERMLRNAIIIGTIPAIIAGLTLEHYMDSIFRSALIVAGTLIAGSLLMLFAERIRTQSPRQHPTMKDGFIIGLYQCLALVPGVSRSGATISGGLLQGISRETATKFSFLLSLPIITGSGLLKLYKALKDTSTAVDFSRLDLFVGFFFAFVVGYFSIRWLMKYLSQHSLHIFIWYRIGLATLTLALLFFRP